MTTTERDLARDLAHDAPASQDRELTPGRTMKSMLLQAPRAPLVSGILMRQANGMSGAAPEQAVAAANGSSGHGLPDALRTKFETSLGTDLSAVRVHTGAESQHASRAVGANAYALGNSIHFAAGQYDPGSSRGQLLLAHEVAHTVQQRGASPMRQNQLAVSAPGDAAEREADRAAAAMVTGGRASVSYIGGGVVQRDKANEEIELEADEVQENASGQMREDGDKAVKKARKVTPARQTDGGSVFADTAQIDMYMGRISDATGPIGQLQGREQRLNEALQTTVDKSEPLTSGARALAANQAILGKLRELKKSGQRQDIKHSMFAPAFQTLQEEFLRLKASVDVIKAQNVKVTGEGAASDVAAAKKENPALGVAIANLNTAIAAMKEFASNPAAGVGAIASAVGNTFDQMNTATEAMNLPPPVLEDSEKVAEANAAVAKVNADLDAARTTIGTIKQVVDTAISVSSGAGTVSAILPDAAEIVEKAKKGVNEATDATNLDGVKNVAGKAAEAAQAEIEGQIAAWLTNYDIRIASAAASAAAIKSAFNIEVKQISSDAVRNLTTELSTKIKELYAHRIQLEKKKAAVTDAAKHVEEEAKKQGKNGTDIGAAAQALASVSNFLTQAYEAKTLGDQEMVDGEKAASQRTDVAGNYESTATPGMEGTNRGIATTSGSSMYYECTVAGDADDRGEDLSGYELTSHEIHLVVNSDDVNQRSVVMKDRTKQQLGNIESWTQEARGFEADLNATLGTGPSTIR